MSPHPHWNSSYPLRMVVIGFLTLLLNGCWGILAADKAYAQERIVLKGVPYFHQRSHFD